MAHSKVATFCRAFHFNHSPNTALGNVNPCSKNVRCMYTIQLAFSRSPGILFPLPWYFVSTPLKGSLKEFVVVVLSAVVCRQALRCPLFAGRLLRCPLFADRLLRCPLFVDCMLRGGVGQGGGLGRAEGGGQGRAEVDSRKAACSKSHFSLSCSASKRVFLLRRSMIKNLWSQGREAASQNGTHSIYKNTCPLEGAMHIAQLNF